MLPNSVIWLITDFGPFEDRYDDAPLGEIRRYGLDKGIDIVLGSWSICPLQKHSNQIGNCLRPSHWVFEWQRLASPSLVILAIALTDFLREA